MTKRERKRILYRVAEEVATAPWGTYTCNAIAQIGGYYGPGDRLRVEYGKFYEKDLGKCWFTINGDLPLPHRPIVVSDKKARGWRLMLLLWFAEVGPEGIE